MSISNPESPPSSKKRKRQDTKTEEIEVDITAPEPPSKKALRKAKKGKQVLNEAAKKAQAKVDATESEDEKPETSQPPKRSEYGIWIGNLSWSASKSDLRTFLTSNTDITDASITRLHMPPPNETATTARSFIKAQNKGFAYVDFSTQTALDEALALSESLLTGRRVLIKDSKSFEGRPDKPKEDVDAAVKSGKPPSKRIFVGNLDFDTTKENIQEHFSKCGDVLDVKIATFEDSGKCKGYGWVEFDTAEASEAAVRGWVEFDQNSKGSDSDAEEKDAEGTSRTKRKPRPRKWWVNKLHGRPLRMEFAEAKEVRYKKRFGKKGTSQEDPPAGRKVEESPGEAKVEEQSQRPGKVSASRNSTPHYLKTGNPKRIDARNIAPGAALAAATSTPRLQGSIIASQGKKTVLA